MSAIFDESYYQSNNYTNYLQREDRYSKLAKEITELLDNLNLNNGPVLDFGCAVGFLIKGLIKTGHNVSGVDISDWAVEKCRSENLNVSKEIDFDKSFGTVFALDVLEHMTVEEVKHFLENIKTNTIVFRIPICKNEGENYFLEVSRKDPSHIIRWTKQQWAEVFKSFGFHTIDLNLKTIYTSEGVYSGVAIK